MSKKDIEREYKNLTKDVFKFEISPHMAKMLELDKEMMVKLDDRYYRIIEEDHFTNLLTQQREEAEQRGFNKAWGVVKKLMSFGSPEEAETYLQSLDKGEQGV